MTMPTSRRVIHLSFLLGRLGGFAAVCSRGSLRCGTFARRGETNAGLGVIEKLNP